MARRTTTPMTPLDSSKTKKAINRRTGHAETIAAFSADGHWSYGREDDHGTRWYVHDLRTGQDAGQFGALGRARHWTYQHDQHHTEATGEPIAS